MEHALAPLGPEAAQQESHDEEGRSPDEGNGLFRSPLIAGHRLSRAAWTPSNQAAEG